MPRPPRKAKITAQVMHVGTAGRVASQKRKTIPADGWAICVQLFVFKPARLKLGALYTNPRYSARNDRRLVNAYCAPRRTRMRP